jgi:hypothetical protein
VAVALVSLALVGIAAAFVVGGGDDQSPTSVVVPDTEPAETPTTVLSGRTTTSILLRPGASTVLPGTRPPVTLPHITIAPIVTSPPVRPSTPTTAAPGARGASRTAAFVWVAVGVIALAIGILIGVRLGRGRRHGGAPEPPERTLRVKGIATPPAPGASQVFISHDTDADGHVARTLAAQLAEHRLLPWLAPDSIPPGEEWVFAIERGLTTSKAALILLSPAALASGWVRKEIQIIVDLEIAGRLYVVPVRVAPCDVPLLLNAYQWVDVGNFERAAAELSRRFAVATDG